MVAGIAGHGVAPLLQAHAARKGGGPVLSGRQEQLSGKDGLAHDRILERVRNYRYPPQTRLTQDRLVDELKLGATPIRNALKLLYAEGLIGHEENVGFFIKSPSVVEIRKLYCSVEALACGAIDVAQRHKLAPLRKENEACLDRAAKDMEAQHIKGAPLANYAAILFASICKLANGDTVMRAINNANDRLYFVRTIEGELLSDTQKDLDEMRRLLKAGRFEELAGSVAVFHQKRSNILADLVDRVYLRAVNLHGGQEPA